MTPCETGRVLSADDQPHVLDALSVSSEARRESCKRLLGGNLVLALHQAARIVSSDYVTEPNVVRQCAEERNPASNEHRHAGDNKTLNQPRPQEPLNCDPTVDVEVVGTAGTKLRNDVSRRPGHLFHNASGPEQVDGATTQDHHAFVTIGPVFHGQNRLEGLATYHNRIDSCYELVVAVGLASARRQKVRSPFGRAMKPSTLVPTKTDTVIVVIVIFSPKTYRRHRLHLRAERVVEWFPHTRIAIRSTPQLRLGFVRVA